MLVAAANLKPCLLHQLVADRKIWYLSPQLYLLERGKQQMGGATEAVVENRFGGVAVCKI